MDRNIIHTDILVVGSGLAGLLFSLELAQKSPKTNILILSKKQKEQSSSYMAQGGIAAVLPHSMDSRKQHILDTFNAGAFTNKVAAVEHFVSNAPVVIQTLENWGVKFDKNQIGNYNLALEGGHSTHRVLHHKDFTGRHIMQQLYANTASFSNIKLLEDVEVLELLKEDSTNTVKGAQLWDYKNKKAVEVHACSVVLATGGLGDLYKFTTNPSTANGNGIALAKNAGAEISELMNIQFHPTALWRANSSQLPLISEALRGAGAVLKNEIGYPFMQDQHPKKDLAPRDVIARCIVAELKKQILPYVFLDATAISKREWKGHFSEIYEICTRNNIDPKKEFIPVVPAAHYSCGGIATDFIGTTKVKQLFAIGEVAHTGFHGSNRLASNSLLETCLMAIGLAEKISMRKIKHQHNNNLNHIMGSKLNSTQLNDSWKETIRGEIKTIMSKYCGVVKTTLGLETAEKELQMINEKLNTLFPQESIERKTLQLTLDTALLVVHSSRFVTENNGVFFNQDLMGNSLQVS